MNPAVTLTGQITDPAGHPLAGARLYAKPPGGGRPQHSFTSEDGAYAFEGLGAGVYSLDIMPPPDSELPQQTTGRLEIHENRTMDIQLEPGVELRGSVTDTDVAPVEGVLVSAHYGTGQGGSAMTDTEGRFSMRVIPGVYTVTTRPPDGSPLLERTERDVRVDAGSQLDVILETGERFVLAGQGTGSELSSPMRLYALAHRLPASALWVLGRTAEGEVEADGAFEFTLEQGEYDLTAGYYAGGDPGTISGRRIAAVNLSRDVRHSVDLPLLEDLFPVRGHIRFEGYGPQYAYIGAYEPGTGNFSCSISICEMGGAYNLVLPAGTYDLTIAPCPHCSGPQFTPRRIEGVVVKGHTLRDLTVDLSADTAVEDEAQALLLPPHLGSSFLRRR